MVHSSTHHHALKVEKKALTNDPKSALDLILLGYSVFIGDQASVGKYFLVERIYHELFNRKKRVSLTWNSTQFFKGTRYIMFSY